MPHVSVPVWGVHGPDLPRLARGSSWSGSWHEAMPLNSWQNSDTPGSSGAESKRGQVCPCVSVGSHGDSRDNERKGTQFRW